MEPKSDIVRGRANDAERQLATEEVRDGRAVLALPAKFARAAVVEYLAWYVGDPEEVEIVDELGAELGAGEPLGADEWAILLPRGMSSRLHEVLDVRGRVAVVNRAEGVRFCFRLPRHVIAVPPRKSALVRRALEQVKPEVLDERGLPLPWVAPRRPTERLGGRPGVEADVELVALDAKLEPAPAVEPDPRGEVPTAEIEALCERLRAHLRVPAPELVVRWGDTVRHGLTTGRVWYGDDFRPRRVRLTVCPNSDRAEVFATLVHEFAHPASRTTTHGAEFKRTLVELASAAWGEAWFREAAARVGERHHLVDAWVASGIRAALAGAAPPVTRAGDDGQTARIVSRIQKLRALAGAQPGEPEAIAATARANDLITSYGLAGYEVHIDAAIDDQMVDRWVQLGKRKVWQRRLAAAVADFCHVFALSMNGDARMHFFGTYRDVVAAEYLWAVAADSIRRRCDAHLAQWKQTRARRPSGGQTRKERTSFCDSAVYAFAKKLRAIREQEGQAAGAAPDSADARGWRLLAGRKARAEAFAREEHEKRGIGWRSGSGKAIRFNQSGYDAGSAMQVALGVAGRGPAPQLEGGG